MAMTAGRGFVGGETFGLGPMALAIQGLYRVAVSVTDFIDDHIANLKRSANATIAGTGRVLEGAKYGFGIGYIAPIAIIAVGQLLLGNTFSAVVTLATAATLSNPIAMTCAAVGAIYYGWAALSDKERNEVLQRLAEGLSLGVELIRSLVDFVIRTTLAFFGSEQLTEFKTYIKEQAGRFGRSLYDVTGKVGDLARGAADKVAGLAGQAFDATGAVMRDGADVARAAGTAIGGATTEAADRIGKTASEVIESSVTAGKRVLRRKPRATDGGDRSAQPSDKTTGE